MRHPLSTTGSGGAAEGAVAVGDVDGLVVQLALAQAVPQDFQPAVAERSEGGMVGLAAPTLGVVELPGPAGLTQAAKRPLLDGAGEVAVAGQPAGDHQLAFAGAAGDRGLARVALQRVRRLVLADVVADLAGDPGGEAVTEAGKAQVDLAAREPLPLVQLLGSRLFGAAVAGGAKQQRAHAALPGAPLGADGQQLGSGQADGVGFGVDQVVAWGELVGGQRGLDVVGEAVGPAVLAGAGEADQLLAGGGGKGLGGGPALQQPQHGGGAKVVCGQLQRGREGRQQVLAQAVEQAALVAGGAFVVAGDRAQLAGALAVGNQRSQAGIAVQGQQAGDAGVFGVVFLFGGAAAPCDQVGVDRQHRVASVDQPLDQQPVAGLNDYPDLGRVGFQGGDVGQQRCHRGRGVVDPADLGHPLAWLAQRDEVEVLGPVDPNGKHPGPASFARRAGSWRRGAVLMDQSSKDDTLVGVGPPGPAPWDAVSFQSSSDKQGKHSQGVTP